MTIAVIYLAREPEGFNPFIESYRTHPAGIAHDLILAIKPKLDLPEMPEPHIELFYPDWPLDLSIYRAAAEQYRADFYCLLNSWSVILADNWLLNLYNAASKPSVGIAGCTGSWESFYSNRPTWINERHFPQFPNAHIRTNGLMIRRDVFMQVWPKMVVAKRQAYLFEHGKDSLTRQVQAMGLRPVVVSMGGVTWEADDWNRAGTYRTLQQSFLMIADNQTRQWDAAGEMERDRLGKAAWGL